MKRLYHKQLGLAFKMDPIEAVVNLYKDKACQVQLLMGQRGALSHLLKCAHPEQPIQEESGEQPQHIKQMKKLNDATWQFFLHGFTIPFKGILANPAPDLECI